MGKESYLTAIGKFKPEIADCLDYPAEAYEGVLPSTVVVVDLLSCPTSQTSRRMAEAVGVNVNNFDTFELNEKKVNYSKLRKVAEDVGYWVYDDFDEIEQLARLFKYKFRVFFRPG